MQFSKSIKLNIIDNYLLISLYSFLPISFILGNAIINLNIVFVDLFYIYSIYKYKNLSFKNYRFDLYFFILILLYVLINSIVQNLINQNYSYTDEGLLRSIGLIRFIIFYFATIYFFNILGKNNNKIFLFWTLILSIVIFDIFYERINGSNIFNITSPSNERIASFFGDELIVGYFIFGFGFICVSFIFEQVFLKKNEYLKLLPIFYLTVIPITIFITGERANFIKSIIFYICFLLFLTKYKHKINVKTVTLLVGIILAGILFQSENLKTRYATLFKEIRYAYKSDEDNLLSKSKHYYNFKMGYDIFLENKFFGVGNKKFRGECLKKKQEVEKKYFNFGCSTHPHHTYLELLSENGLIGFILIFIASIIFILKQTKSILNSKNLIKLSGLLFFVLLWIPFLPYGSFFSTTSFSLTIINLSIARSFSD